MKLESRVSNKRDRISWLLREVSLPPHGSPERAKLEKEIPELESLRDGPVTPADYQTLVYGNPIHELTAEEWSLTPELFRPPPEAE